jgi:hypothetical protein
MSPLSILIIFSCLIYAKSSSMSKYQLMGLGHESVKSDGFLNSSVGLRYLDV